MASHAEETGSSWSISVRVLFNINGALVFATFTDEHSWDEKSKRREVGTQRDVPAGEDEDDPERLRHDLPTRRERHQRNPHLRSRHHRNENTSPHGGVRTRRGKKEVVSLMGDESAATPKVLMLIVTFSGVIHLPRCRSASLADLTTSPT
jgi:hypothetical protein